MYTVKSPTRFDMAGGTLDMWPVWAMLGSATTINVAIDIMTHCSLTPLPNSEIIIESEDFKKQWSFPTLHDFLGSADRQLLFFQAHVRHWKPAQGFKLKTRSDSPVGGGLGGSSSLSISVYKAFEQWCGKSAEDVNEMVRHCGNIEAFVLRTPTGTQDYYPPALGGMCVIDYDFHGPRVQSLQNHKDIGERFIVVDTGRSHHSGINNWQVLKKFIEGDKMTTSALEKIAEVASDMRQACISAQWQKVPQLFDREFEARLMLAESFMSPEIAKLKDISTQVGAEGFKICGAGGGGCVVVWTAPSKKQDIKKQIQEHGFRVIDTQLA